MIKAALVVLGVLRAAFLVFGKTILFSKNFLMEKRRIIVFVFIFVPCGTEKAFCFFRWTENGLYFFDYVLLNNERL
jgi:hypothetical protein